MTRTQIENIYKANGLNDFKLKNKIDLLKVHGFEIEKTEGYENLSDENRAIYEKFILNFFNSFGLESRILLLPKKINFVEHIEHLTKEFPEDDYFIVAGETIFIINKSNEKIILKDFLYQEFKNRAKFVEESKSYLRFEYQYGFNKEGHPVNQWLHITKQGKEWY